jgi:hypothetical protein
LAENSTVLPKRKHSLLPVLIVLFLIAYGMMTMLIIEQGNTINSQQLVIRQLFSDSVQLSALRAQAAKKQQAKADSAISGTTPQPKPQLEQRPKANALPRLGPKVIAPQAAADERRTVVRI